ncbi:Helicase associated domain protein [Streptomyces goshikiensis]|uniref:DEAD/DEAH box helicase n=1 Tax=Streptomyces goshikiensis TaxID=1942 RepID=UPI0037F47249
MSTTAIALRPYQQEAIEAIHTGLAGGGRGQLHAACGSGKTLIGALAATRLEPGPALLIVLVPSLSLVSQTLTGWRQHVQLDAVLAVCSDDTITDAPAHLDDIDAETTTDVAEIVRWIGRTRGRRLIVGTYHSAHRLAEALRIVDRPADLVILDEAHHLAGRVDGATRQVLTEEFLPARRRLFMTATPRVDDVRVETLGALSMDDATVFGPVLYQYAWARAISEGYLDDYRIVVMGATESQVIDLLQDEGHAYTDTVGGADFRMLAAQAVIAQAARKYGLRRILAFCPRVDAAREFSATLPRTLARLPHSSRPDVPVNPATVTGEMSHAEREQVLGILREPGDGWSVVANVRCLSEGVDVPTVDAVAFTNPKRSQVDIVQAVGRALRRSPDGSGTATIVVPIVVPDSAEEIGDLDPGEFKTLWQVIRALRAHDESLGVELDMTPLYARERGGYLPSKITIELPPGASDKMLAQLTALTIRQTSSAWWEGYAHAAAFRSEHGHLTIPSAHLTEDGFRLGTWIANARQHYRKGWLRPDRIQALERIDMVWETKSRPWKRFVEELAAFREKHGHALVPQSYQSPDGYNLGTKVNSARQRLHQIPAGYRAELDDLGMIWDTRHLRWQEFFNACLEYKNRHGHLKVPSTYVSDNGYRLGAAVSSRRSAYRKGTLPAAEAASLEEIGFVFEANLAWVGFLAACDRYVAAHGSLAGVRKDHIDDTGYPLGSTIAYYRTLHAGTKAKGREVPAQRRAELDARGMVWRLAPIRPVTDDEAAVLRTLTDEDLGREVTRLVDEGVTQTSIAPVVGVAQHYLTTKIRDFRSTGRWPQRRRGDQG